MFFDGPSPIFPYYRQLYLNNNKKSLKKKELHPHNVQNMQVLI